MTSISPAGGRLLRAALLSLWWSLALVLRLLTFGGFDLTKGNFNRGALSRIWGFLGPFLISTERMNLSLPSAVRLPFIKWRGLAALAAFVRHWGETAAVWLLVAVSFLTLFAVLLLGGGSPVTPSAVLEIYSVYGLTFPALALQALAAILLVRALVCHCLQLAPWQVVWKTVALPGGGRTIVRGVPEWCLTWSLILMIAFGTWLTNHYSVMVNDLNGTFLNAVTEKDAQTFTAVIFTFGTVLATYRIVIEPVYSLLKQAIMLMWIRFSTRLLLRLWSGDSRQYVLSLLGHPDNPSQRIEQNARTMCMEVMQMLFIFLDAVVTLFAFWGILWQREAGLSYATQIGDHQLVLEHVVLSFVIIYALVGNNGVVRIGRRLIVKYGELAERVGDWRSSMVLFGKNAEPIAAYRGEEREMRHLWGQYARAFRVSFEIVGWQRLVQLFTGIYSQISSFVPYVLLAPFFFEAGSVTVGSLIFTVHGHTDFGSISRAAGACDQILTSFTLIVSQFERIAETLASVNRCAELKEALLEIEGESSQARPRVARREGTTGNGNMLTVSRLTLKTPFGTTGIIRDLDLQLDAGELVFLVGPSGCGKTSIFRAIAGFPYWDWGSGSIDIVERRRLIVLSQSTYTLEGADLRSQLIYPGDRSVNDEQLIDHLDAAQLGDWLRGKFTDQLLSSMVPAWDALSEAEQSAALSAQRGRWMLLDEGERHSRLLAAVLPWDLSMSGGERQRLMVARALANDVDLIIADEPTAGLDGKNAAAIYQTIDRAGITMLSSTHNRDLLRLADRVVVLDGKGGWRIVAPGQLEQLPL